MPPDHNELLEDIIDVAVNIRSVTSSMDREGFFQDYKATAAVERWFIIIGEALRRLRDHHSEVAEKIPDLAGPSLLKCPAGYGSVMANERTNE